MSLVTWSFPTTVVFGAGALSTLADHMKRLGKSRVLVVCDPGVRKAGLVDRALDVLKRAGVEARAFDGVDPNPVAAVTRGGIDVVSSGSRIATLASRYGLKMTVFRWLASSVTTPERPTSLPVPAVVGIATSGGTFGPMKRSPPVASS